MSAGFVWRIRGHKSAIMAQSSKSGGGHFCFGPPHLYRATVSSVLALSAGKNWWAVGRHHGVGQRSSGLDGRTAAGLGCLIGGRARPARGGQGRGFFGTTTHGRWPNQRRGQLGFRVTFWGVTRNLTTRATKTQKNSRKK